MYRLNSLMQLRVNMVRQQCENAYKQGKTQRLADHAGWRSRGVHSATAGASCCHNTCPLELPSGWLNFLQHLRPNAFHCFISI
jgi:hypothetical protein